MGDTGHEKRRHDPTQKGLPAGTVGLLGATVIGISCVAPGYTLAAALGPIVAKVGAQTPAIILLGFVPMLFVALAYRELNRAMPDSGTAFTWVTRAFGPWIGWLTGWGLVASTVLVLSNTAGVAVDFFYLMIAQITRHPEVAHLTENAGLNISTCLVFMALATWISYRGMAATKAFQYVLVGIQVVVLAVYSVVALVKVSNGTAYDPTPVRLAWFNPLEISSASAVAAGLSLSIFIAWGWDVTLAMNEETKGSRTTPGQAATTTVLSTVLLYVLASAASIAFAGLGKGALGLGNPHIQVNAFLGLAGPVLGGFALLMSLAVLSSSAASLQATIINPSRTLLAMGHYDALPAALAKISPRYGTPSVAIFTSTFVSSAFYAVMRAVSQHMLWDTVSALGIMICFYYSFTALAAVWYFRKQWFKSRSNFMNQFVFPLLGGISLAALFFRTLSDSLDPGFGSGSQVGGIGLVFIIGMGIIALGVILMLITAVFKPAFFRGERLSVSAFNGTENQCFDEHPI